MDLAEVVEDFMCTFEGTGDTTMDTLAMLIFGWILAALFLLWLGRILYARFSNRSSAKNNANNTNKISEVRAPSEGKTIDVTDAKKSAALLQKGGSFKAPSAGGKGYVPPTPPVRKRLTRPSPGPELRKPRFIPAPQCTGPDNISVLWVNDVFQWLYNDLVIVSELVDVWIHALNEYMQKATVEQGVGVELVRILPETNPPTIGNVFAECDSKDDVTITCDCEATPAFQLKSVRQKDDKTEISHYRVNINRLRARLNIYCITDKLQADVKCDGWPDIKVALAPVGNIKNNMDETQLQEVIIDILACAIRNSEVHLNLAQYPTCPKLIRHIEMPQGQFYPIHYDNMTNTYSQQTPNHLTMNTPTRTRGERRLLVKVIRANGLQSGCHEPFCVIEMDEPSQKNQTSIQKSTDSPFWDEHFLFDLTRNTAEILFEIYDHGVTPHKFLGLGIVGVEELLINPSQRQIISLQSRPYESDPITGTLTVEFLFIEGADIPHVEGSTQPYKIKESLRTVSPNRPPPNATSTPTHDRLMPNGNHVDLRDLSPSRFSTPTHQNPLVHNVQRQPSQRLVKTGDMSATSTLQSQQSQAQTNQEKEPEFRGRARKRRDFFGTIKRRLGKSKNRSKSATGGPNNEIGRDDSLNRSVSADRSRNDTSYRLGVPGQRSMEETSRRSSLSEASGLSTASGRTYINEASTLVLETLENGIKKHYLVPLSLAQKSKWKKKGTKLHIFNDHTFIARHLSGSVVCQVCAKNIARRIGKQGYECRDCQLKCHKHCHVKVNDNCPTSNIHNIELSYITNPYTDKNLSLL